MTSTKRTRSQLTLPEFHPHLARSPLKDARMARRNNPPTPPQPLSAESDDEMLLSPRKTHVKRPSSPLKDQLLPEPQMKRRKHEHALVRDHAGTGECHSPSTTTQELPLYPSPHSPRFRRSQSVPSQSVAPHIDLNCVPRSPVKPAAPLRFASVPPVYNSDAHGRAASPPTIAVQTATPRMASPKRPVPLSPLTPLPQTPFTSRYQPPGALAAAPEVSGKFPTAFNGTPGSSALWPQHRPTLVESESSSNPTSDKQNAIHPPFSTPRANTPVASTSRLPRPSIMPTPVPLSPEPLKPASKGKQRRTTAQAPIPLGGRMTRSASLRLRENKKRDAEPTKVVSYSSSSTSVLKPTPKTPSVVTSSQHKRSRTVSHLRSNTPISTPSVQKSTLVASSMVQFVSQPPSESKPTHSSSLSSLQVALDKLNMPPPSRPSTSMGFNVEPPAPRDDAAQPRVPDPAKARTSNDNSAGRASAQSDGPSAIRAPPLKQSASASNSSARPAMRQMTLAFSLTGSSAPARAPLRSVPIMPKGPLASAKDSSGGPGKRIFGVAAMSGGLPGRGRVVHRASQKSSLPVVEGSPVKGLDDDAEDREAADPPPIPSLDIQGELTAHVEDKVERTKDEAGKPAEPRKRDTSRRASLASHLLAESVSGQLQTPTAFATPPSSGAATAPGKGKAPANKYGAIAGTRSAPGRTGIHASLRSAAVASPSTPDNSDAGSSSMAVLKECTIFVDVRTDDGDNAGALFVDMLKGMGARILSRVGQTCTHIVFKNGLVSTLTRYRLLNEPRPLVVGIAWVVECAEQRTRLDETRFLINLDGTNVAGANKRRRSMLPKQLQAPVSGLGRMGPPEVPRSANSGTKANGVDREDVFPSPMAVDPAADSLAVRAEGSFNSPQDDSLAPLEKARRRRSMMLGS